MARSSKATTSPTGEIESRDNETSFFVEIK